MVIADRSFKNVKSFARHQQFYGNEVLSDKLDSFLNDDFWEDKNIIDPTQDIRKAIKNITKK
jgi:hypothetical protein